MKVKLKKKHLDFSKGEVLDVSTERAQYWIGIGLAEIVKTRKTKEKKVNIKKK